MQWRSQYSPIGLDIGSHQVKLVQLKGNENQWAVHDIAVAPLDGTGDAQAEGHNEHVLHCLTNLLETGAFVGNKTVSLVPSSEVDIRMIQVPLKEGVTNNAEVVRREAASSLPYGIDEAILDSIAIAEDGEGETAKQRRLLVSARRASVDHHISLLREARLDCLALDVLPLALSRLLLHHQYLSTVSPVLVVDIGCHYSTAFVLWRGVLIYNRTFAWGGEPLTQALMKALDMSRDRAELLKQQYGVEVQVAARHTLTDVSPQVNVKALPGLVYEIVRPQLEYLAQELERILSYWGAQSHSAMIDRVLLSGGTAALKNLPGYLEHRIGMDVSVTEPWGNFSMTTASGQTSQAQGFLTPAVATAIGLALRGRPTHG